MRPEDPKLAVAGRALEERGAVSNPDQSGWSQIDRCVFALRELLFKGAFRGGERISELPLAARLKVSRTPIRLALDRLAHEGLIEANATGGFVVREFTQADIWDAIELRGVLEGTAVRLAAERHGGEAELGRLRSLCEELERVVPVTLESFSTYLELNAEFHAEWLRLAGSRVVAQSLERIHGLPFAAPAALVFGAENAQPEVSLVAQEQHRSIVEAIARREGARAEFLAREHARVAQRNLVRVLKDSQLMSRLPGAALIHREPASGGKRRRVKSK